MPQSPLAPVAWTQPFVRRIHGDAVDDPYHWMSDKTDPRLLDYLTAENEYAQAVTAHLAGLREEIYQDIAARTLQTDLSVPAWVTHTDGSSWWYLSRTTEGLDYPRVCRIPGVSRDDLPDATEPHPDEQVLLDVNDLAAGHDFAALGWAEVSPNGRLLGYSVDTDGDERYDLWVRDLATGSDIAGPIAQVGAGGAWLGDDTLYYMRVNDAWRPFQVWRHQLGEPHDDTCVFEEPDEAFWVGVDGSRDREWVIIDVASKTTSESHLIHRDSPTAPRCVAPRRDGVEYSVEVARDRLYVLHNANGPQFELAAAPLDATDPADWVTVIPERPQTRLLDVDAYDRWLVVNHRTDGLTGVTVWPLQPDASLGEPTDFRFDEELYEVDAQSDPDPETDRVRLSFQSLTTPASVIEYRLDSGEQTVLRRTPVRDHPTHGPYQPADYVSERVWATADDGTRVPISLVRHRDTPIDGTSPCLLYGYGSYELCTQVSFRISRLSLLDRGFVFAIAHVRGGGELGRSWYEDGKLMHKRNTFTDFIACGRHLVATGYAAPGRLVAEGGSAGGLLMGAVANQAPDLFRAIHAAVPFVDALTTVLNPDLPLTVIEWEEWGDPLHDPEAYAYIKSYSPYDNVAAQEYPAILATTSMQDTRVEVTEPAKWIAKLRTHATNGPDRPILLKTELAAGHGGASARYRAWRDRAFELAWLIDQVGANLVPQTDGEVRPQS